MADTGQSARQKRRIRESTETVRERGARGDVISAAPVTRGPVRRGLSAFFGLAVWKPVRVIGRLVAKYIIPPYFKNSYRELKLVTWPNRKQSRQLTFAVMVFAVIFGIIIALVDYGLDKLFKKIILNQ